jgi:RHS repeat-associated protein
VIKEMAMRKGSSTLNYQFGDHLGSTALTTNSSGLKVAEIRYNPWGTERYTYGTTPTTYHFTGQRLESYINLYWYGSRWYDAALGRFTQADSIVPIQSSNDNGVKKLQLSLIVDYNENDLLNQLYRNQLEEDTKYPDNKPSTKSVNHKSMDINPLETEDETDKNKIGIPTDFNELSNIGRIQVTTSEHDKNKTSLYVDQAISTQPIIYTMNLDRYAYVSNCPTKYTDPSGHCNIAIAIAGGLLMIGGGLVGAGGTVVLFTGIGALGAGQIEGLGGIAVGGIMGFTGLGIAGLGGYLIYKSDCIPDVSP